jgi:Uncharacterized protein conserved in bacteria
MLCLFTTYKGFAKNYRGEIYLICQKDYPESTEGLKQITDINGELIYTTKILDMYRRWIENIIKDVKCIEFIDATEGGALIKGIKIKKLSEVIIR